MFTLELYCILKFYHSSYCCQPFKYYYTFSCSFTIKPINIPFNIIAVLLLLVHFFCCSHFTFSVPLLLVPKLLSTAFLLTISSFLCYYLLLLPTEPNRLTLATCSTADYSLNCYCTIYSYHIFNCEHIFHDRYKVKCFYILPCNCTVLNKYILWFPHLFSIF